jgi:hypothetical protein
MNKISKVIILSLMVGAAYSADTQMSRYTTMKESVPIKKVD